MTDKMKTFLTRASSDIGVTASMINECREANKRGWVKCIGAPQNSTALRYKITPAGAAAINA